jgi:hypothetical protein
MLPIVDWANVLINPTDNFHFANTKAFTSKHYADGEGIFIWFFLPFSRTKLLKPVFIVSF